MGFLTQQTAIHFFPAQIPLAEEVRARSPEAIRAAGGTYQLRLWATVVLRDEDEERVMAPVEVCRFPLMRGLPGFDPEPLPEGDVGGYFLVEGGARAVVSQERAAPARLLVRAAPRQDANLYSHVAEIPGSGFYAKRLRLGGAVRIECSALGSAPKPPQIPAAVLLAALAPPGVPVGIADVVRAAVGPGLGRGGDPFGVVAACIEEGERVQQPFAAEDTRGAALAYLERKLLPTGGGVRRAGGDKARRLQPVGEGGGGEGEGEGADDADEEEDEEEGEDTDTGEVDILSLLSARLLPHVAPLSAGGSTADRLLRKLSAVAQAVARLATVDAGCVDGRGLDDRERLECKRVLPAGAMMDRAFRSALRGFFSFRLRSLLDRLAAKKRGRLSQDDVRKVLGGLSSEVTLALTRALKTGVWPSDGSRSASQLVGVSQLLPKDNRAAARSCLRRVVSASASAVQDGLGSVITASRMLNGSMLGRLCFVTTPDGSDCGLKRELALSASCTVTFSLFSGMHEGAPPLGGGGRFSCILLESKSLTKTGAPPLDPPRDAPAFCLSFRGCMGMPSIP